MSLRTLFLTLFFAISLVEVVWLKMTRTPWAAVATMALLLEMFDLCLHTVAYAMPGFSCGQTIALKSIVAV